MFPQVARSGLTLTKVISGISKTLNIANQVIPIYMQAKPMIQNAKSTFKVAKELLAPKPNSNQNTNTFTKTQQTTSNIDIIPKQTNNPTFFI